MFNTLAVASLALLAVSSVSGLVVPRKEPPPGWATNWLENYQVYHTRYLALDCQNKHGQPFFNECCHPLLKDESLSSRPAICTPSTAASSSASAAEPTSTVTTPASDPDCEDGGDDEDDEDGEDCDDDDDDDGDDDGDDECSSEPEEPASTTAAFSSTLPSSSALPSSSVAPAPVNVAPKPTISTPKPIPSSTHASSTPTKESSSVKVSSTPSSSTPAPTPSNPIVTGGVATFFYQNGVAGACGVVHPDSALIAAIDQDRYGNSGDVSPLCGQQVEITNTNNGKTVTVTIADDCPTCINGNSIDLSTGAFQQIATEEEGEVPIEWRFIN